VNETDQTRHGSCMCGDVAYTVHGAVRDVFNCHCDRCRRFTGHHMAATAASPSQVQISGEVTWYSAAEGVEYGFCAHCGSSLFWRTAADPKKLCITAGSLDQPTGLRTTRAWYVAEIGDYYERPLGLEEFDYER
jgi:hypothetical protein